MVENAGRKCRQVIFVEDRTNHADIIQMPSQGPGIIGDEYIPGFITVLRKLVNDVLDSQCHSP